MIEFRLRSLAETTSTNDEVKRALEAGEAEGLVVSARRQIAGYGRQGRTWTSPDGGLYCSLLLRPQVAARELPTLSLVVGMAVRRALAGIAPCAADRIRIKWPNDVVLLQDESAAADQGERATVAQEACGPEVAGQDDPAAAARNPGHDLGHNPGCNPGHELGHNMERNLGHTLEHNLEHILGHDPERNPDHNLDHNCLAQNARYERFSQHCENRDLRFYDSGAKQGAENRSQRAFCATEAAPSRPRHACVPAFAKLCGISLEAHAGGVCAGVGVNVLPPAESPDVGGKNRAAYVADLAGEASPCVEAVRDAVLAAFAPLYDEWARAGFAALVDEFNAHASLTGNHVSMVDLAGNALASGQVVRVDDFGRLILRDAAGVETPVSSGEAHIV